MSRVTANALQSADSEYVKAVDRLKSLILKKLMDPLWGNRFVYPFTANGKEYEKCLKISHEFTRSVIDENIANRKNERAKKGNDINEDESPTTKKKKVFIDTLLELHEEGNIDIKGIEDEVNTFMFAGHDTTSSALSWMLYEIGRHPHVQSKLHQEVDDICASQETTSSVDKIRSLKYMEFVMKESLRLHPPASGFSRRLKEDLVVDGNVIPAGTFMAVDVIGVHLNPQYWTDPFLFDPQRFRAEESKKRSPYAFIPFSAGPRNCIGQKFAMLDMKVFLYSILLNFDVKSMQDPSEIQAGVQIITSSINGIHIQFNERA